MMHFRCYECWKQLGYNGVRDYMICPACDARLFVGERKSETADVSISAASEHIRLLHKLHDRIAVNKDIFKGKTETIAGEISWYTPDAIYYRNSMIYANQPIIYHIETCDSIFRKHTINKCRLFSTAARNLCSQFYLVVPEKCATEGGRDLANRMLTENGIEPVAIMVL